MVELRKRPAPPPAPPPAKKKAAAKPKAQKPLVDAPPIVEDNAAAAPMADGTPAAALEPEAPIATAPPAADAPAKKSGPPKTGDNMTLEGFGGEVETNDSNKVTLAKLVGDSKAGVVLFTYPKASTPGCTTQANLFREAYGPLTATGLSIYGLSSDSPKSNTTFKTKQNLPYTLLCDPKQTLIGAIGMKKSPSGTTRGCFVVDKSGKVLAAEPGGPAATVEAVKAVVAKMGGSLGADEKAALQNKLVAEVAAEVADSAATMDRSKTGTPVPKA